MSGGGIASGLVIFLLGVLVILRTVTHDDQGQNLVDKVLGLGGGSITPQVDLQPIDPKQLGAQLPPASRRQKTKPHRSAQKARR